MVLALGVIIVGFDAVDLLQSFGKEDDSFCEKAIQEQNTYMSDCAILKETYRWYSTLVFITDIVLVLCFIVVLLLFADWILFVATVRISFIDVHILQALKSK